MAFALVFTGLEYLSVLLSHSIRDKKQNQSPGGGGGRVVFPYMGNIGTPGGGGGISLYGQHRHVPRDRVWFLEVLNP